jgi:hypothetical protein
MPSSIEKLYTAGSKYYDLGGFDVFSTKMTNPESRQKVYDALSAHYDLGDYDTFDSKVTGGLRPVGPIEEAPIQQAEAQPQTPFGMVNRFVQDSVANDPDLAGLDAELNNDLFGPEVGRPQLATSPDTGGVGVELEEAPAVQDDGRSYPEKVKESFRRGMVSADLDEEGFDLYMKQGFGGDVEEATQDWLRRRADFQRQQQEDPVTSGNPLSKAFLSAVEMTGPMAKGTLEGLIFGGIAAGTTGPAAVATAPIATMIGAGQYWTRQGFGSMYAANLEKGIDPKVAGAIAGGMAPIYAAIEFSQVSKIAPGLEKAMVRKLSDSATKIVAKAAAKYGADIFTESGEEVLQEVTQMAAEEGAIAINNLMHDTPEIKHTSAQQAWDRVYETFKSTLAPMAILLGPKRIHGTAADVKARKELEKEVQNLDADQLKSLGLTEEKLKTDFGIDLKGKPTEAQQKRTDEYMSGAEESIKRQVSEAMKPKDEVTQPFTKELSPEAEAVIKEAEAEKAPAVETDKEVEDILSGFAEDESEQVTQPVSETKTTEAISEVAQEEKAPKVVPTASPEAQGETISTRPTSGIPQEEKPTETERKFVAALDEEERLQAEAEAVEEERLVAEYKAEQQPTIKENLIVDPVVAEKATTGSTADVSAAPVTEKPLGNIEDVKAQKEPWEMTAKEFDAEFMFHGKGESHPLFGKEKITGGATKHYSLASGYATGSTTQPGKGEVHLVRRSELPVGAIQEMKDTGRVDVISGMGVVPAKSAGIIPTGLENPHQYIIEKALSEGRPVSPEVLKDYPDLAAKYGKTAPSSETPSLVFATSGRPFKTEKAALNYARHKGSGYTAVPVEGGFAVKEPEVTAAPKSEGKVISQAEADKIVERELNRLEKENLSWEQDVKFSARPVSTATAQPLGMGVIQVERILRPLKGKLNIPVRVIGSIEDIEDLKNRAAAIYEQRKDNVVSGYYDEKSNEIVVIADGVHSEKELIYDLMNHEIMHYGTAGLLGEKGYAGFLSDLQKDKVIGPQIKKLAEDYGWGSEYAASEWWAMQSEGRDIEKLPTNIINRILFYIRKWLRERFGADRVGFTRNELLDLMRQSYAYALGGEATAKTAEGETAFRVQESAATVLRQLKEVYSAIETLPPVRSGQSTSGIRQRLEAKAQELENRIQSGEVRFRSQPSGPRLEKIVQGMERALAERFAESVKQGLAGEGSKKDYIKKHYSDLIRERIKAIKQGHLIGGRGLKESLDEVKRFILNYAREYLPKEGITRGQVKPLLTAVATAENADDMLVAYDRVDKITRTVTEKELRGDISKLVKKYKTVRKDNRLKGKLVADEQHRVDDINAIIRMKPDQVKAEMEKIFEAMNNRAKDQNNPDAGEATALENEMLYRLDKFGDLRHKTVGQLRAAKAELEEIIATGKSKRQAKDEARREKMNQFVGGQLELLTSHKGILSEEQVAALGKQKKEGIITLGLQGQFSFEYLLDELNKAQKDAKPLHTALNNFFMPKIHTARNSETKGIRETMKMVQEKMAEIYGTKSANELLKLATKNTVPEDTGVKVKQGETEVPLILSQEQAYKLWQEWQDPTLAETFEKMGYTQETINGLEKFITPENMKWAKWQLDEFYPQYYESVNKVFRERYDVDLPFNPVYSPIARRYNRNDAEDDLMLNENKSYFSGVYSRHLMSRVNNTRGLKLLGGDTTLINHILEMEHFKAWAEPMREMRSFFSNEKVRTAIKQNFGPHTMRKVDDFLNDMARGKLDPRGVDHFLDAMRRNFTTAVLGINLTLIPKQMASFPAYWAEIPTTDFWGGFVDFMRNPRKAMDVLAESETLKARYGEGFDRDIMLAWHKTSQHELSGKRSWRDIVMFPTLVGDKVAVVMGGWSVYRYHYRKALGVGMSEADAKKKAMYEFEMSTNRSQQAGNIEDLPSLMRGNSWAKLFTMFQTAPNSYFRIEASAIRNLVRGRGNTAENLKRLAVSHFVLPMLFQFVANGFRWKDDDQFRAALLGSLNGLLIVGNWLEDIAQAGVSTAMKLPYFIGETGGNPVFENFTQLKDAVIRAAKVARDGDYTWKDITFVIDKSADFIGKAIGVPVGAPLRIGEGAYRFMERGEIKPLELLGYSQYALGESNPKRQLLNSLEEYYEVPKDERDPRQLQQLKADIEEYNKNAYKNESALIREEETKRLSREPKQVAMELLSSSSERVLSDNSVKLFRHKLNLALEHGAITQKQYDRYLGDFNTNQEAQKALKETYYKLGEEPPKKSNRAIPGQPRPPQPPRQNRTNRTPLIYTQ